MNLCVPVVDINWRAGSKVDNVIGSSGSAILRPWMKAETGESSFLTKSLSECSCRTGSANGAGGGSAEERIEKDRVKRKRICIESVYDSVLSILIV